MGSSAFDVAPESEPKLPLTLKRSMNAARESPRISRATCDTIRGRAPDHARPISIRYWRFASESVCAVR